MFCNNYTQFESLNNFIFFDTQVCGYSFSFVFLLCFFHRYWFKIEYSRCQSTWYCFIFILFWWTTGGIARAFSFKVRTVEYILKSLVVFSYGQQGVSNIYTRNSVRLSNSMQESSRGANFYFYFFDWYSRIVLLTFLQANDFTYHLTLIMHIITKRLLFRYIKIIQQSVNKGKSLANRSRTSDRWMTTLPLQSTALPTELSRDGQRWPLPKL